MRSTARMRRLRKGGSKMMRTNISSHLGRASGRFVYTCMIQKKRKEKKVKRGR